MMIRVKVIHYGSLFSSLPISFRNGMRGHGSLLSVHLLRRATLQVRNEPHFANILGFQDLLVPSPPQASSIEEPLVRTPLFCFKVVLYTTVVIYLLYSTRWIHAHYLCEANPYHLCSSHIIYALRDRPVSVLFRKTDPHATLSPIWMLLALEVLIASGSASPLEVLTPSLKWLFARITFSCELPSYRLLLAQGSHSRCLPTVSLSLYHPLTRWTPLCFAAIRLFSQDPLALRT